VSPIA